MKNFSKAYDCWQHGRLLKAIHIYMKIAQRQNAEHDAALYLAAYSWLMLAKQAHDEMSVLGVDLAQPYFDYYCKAASCLAQISDKDVDAKKPGLLLLEASEKTEIAQVYEQENALLTSAKKVNYKNYVRTFLLWLRDTSHRLAHI